LSGMHTSRVVLAVAAAAVVGVCVIVAINMGDTAAPHDTAVSTTNLAFASTNLAADSHPITGGAGEVHDKGKVRLSSTVKVFIKQVLDQMHRTCGANHVNIIDLKVSKWERQVTDGTTFKVKVTPIFKSDQTEFQEYTMVINRPPLGEQFHNVHIKEPVGSPKRTSDQFHILSIEPSACELKDPVIAAAGPANPRAKEVADDKKRETGHVNPPETEMNFDTRVLTPTQLATAPSAVNWYTQFSNSRVGKGTGNQGTCGSCYAWAATTALSYRLYKASGGKHDIWPSPQQAMSCTNGCDGGNAYSVYKAMNSGGGFAPFWCAPYLDPAQTNQCDATCGDSLKVTVDSGTTQSISVRSEGSVAAAAQKMAYEIGTNGPAYVALYASSGLQTHRGDGIFMGEPENVGKAANHAVTLVGYGTESGTDYWVIQNSWGLGWGVNGIGRIVRGKDAVGIETGGITFVTPTVPGECASAPKCENGASYDSSCNCHCLYGYSGASCTECNRDCSGGNLGGSPFVSNGQCQCSCQVGYYSMANKECTTSFKLGGSSDAVYKPSGTSVDFSMENPTHSVTVGDFLIAVPQGQEPYGNGGWNTNGVRTYLCGEPSGSGANYCGDINTLPAGYSRSNAYWSELAPNTYDVYYYQWMGKNEFGNDKGFKLGFKLNQQIYIDSCFNTEKTYCSTYVSWGCSARLSSGTTVGQICQKACGLC